MPSFLPHYDQQIAPLLGHRAATMRATLAHLESRSTGNFLIVETGCARQAGNWGGDGQSTVLFDAFVTQHGGAVVSVDKNPEACSVARSLVSERVTVHCDDSVHFLWSYVPPRPIDLVYFDSFDVDWRDPRPSSLHHLKELCAILPKLAAGALLVVDDNAQGKGKGEYLRAFFDDLGVQPLFDAYQLGWVMPGR